MTLLMGAGAVIQLVRLSLLKLPVFQQVWTAVLLVVTLAGYGIARQGFERVRRNPPVMWR